MIIKENFSGDPNIGLYGFATDAYCLLGRGKFRRVSTALKVPAHTGSIMNTDFLGLFATGNSSGFVVPKMIDAKEITVLKRAASVLVLHTDYTALGNMILMNDKGIIISPMIRNQKKQLEKFFGLPCAVGRIAGLAIVGALGIATNNGCLLYPKVKDKEIALIEKVLKVTADIGTVSFGSPFVKAGIIANSNGFVTSVQTSAAEMGRIHEVLGID